MTEENTKAPIFSIIIVCLIIGASGGFWYGFYKADKGWNYGDVQNACNQMCADEINENGDNIVLLNKNLNTLMIQNNEIAKTLQEQHQTLDNNIKILCSK